MQEIVTSDKKEEYFKAVRRRKIRKRLGTKKCQKKNPQNILAKKQKKKICCHFRKNILEIFSKVGKTYCINTFWLPRGGEKYAQICFWSNCFLKKLGKMFICICFVLIFGFIAHILSKYLGNDFQTTHCCVKKCCDE